MKRTICDVHKDTIPDGDESVTITVKKRRKTDNFDVCSECYKLCPFNPEFVPPPPADEPSPTPEAAEDEDLPTLVAVPAPKAEPLEVGPPLEPESLLSPQQRARATGPVLEAATPDANSFPVAPPAATGVTVSPTVQQPQASGVVRYQTTNENALAEDFERSK